MKKNDISILIPTLSRSEFLLKQLYFYKKYEAEFIINICDSTKKPTKRFLAKINSLSNILNINYFHEPNLSDREALQFLLNKTKTKYCTYIGDDDFFIPNGLYQCANYLEENNDCRVVYGKAIILDSDTLGFQKSRIRVSRYWGSIDFEENSVEERLDKFSKNYLVNLFGIQRTFDFLNDYKIPAKIPSRQMSEILTNYLTVAKGKAKFLEIPYLIRQVHSSRYLMSDSLVDSLIKDKIGESIPIFISALSKTFIDKNYSNLKAYKISEKYLSDILLNMQKKSLSCSSENKFFLKFFIKRIYLRIKNGIKNLIFRNSQYYNDFKKYINIISLLK